MPKARSAGITIRIKDPSQAAEVAKRVDAEFENSPHETKTEPEGAFFQGMAKQIGNIVFIVAVNSRAVFFTILLVTGNTMAQAVRERTGELGVLKAIGFTNGRIVVLVLAESCLLAVIGGVVGLGLARRGHSRHGRGIGRPAADVFSARRAIWSSDLALPWRWVWSPEFFPRSRPCACASPMPCAECDFTLNHQLSTN